MKSIADEELRALPTADLVKRMDEFIETSMLERYGNSISQIPTVLPSELINTITVRAKNDQETRLVAHLAFAYLVQLQMESCASGFANRILFTTEYRLTDWQSPAFRLREAALRQYQIVSSRIAFEVFVDLLHALETGRRLESKRSKLAAFRRWLRDPANRFNYFAHVLVAAYEFDRQRRTPEIHGASKIPGALLRLETPESPDISAFELTNMLSGCWRPLIDILNDTRPNYMFLTRMQQAWFDAYNTADPDVLQSVLEEMLDDASNT